IMKILSFIIFLSIIIYFFGWWGVLSLLLILLIPVIIGINRGLRPPTTNYKAALELNEYMPLSSRTLQDILVKSFEIK
ncbi:MAG: hypothetical protein J7L15_00240, partial [Clostridiales bacterium]|nr:hypothetical protein [Clostridiales bacterium]